MNFELDGFEISNIILIINCCRELTLKYRDFRDDLDFFDALNDDELLDKLLKYHKKFWEFMNKDIG